VVAISAKLEQPAPWQRSTRYRVTPTLSVAACQERSIWPEPAAVACRLPGALGSSVSGGVAVVAEAVPE